MRRLNEADGGDKWDWPADHDFPSIQALCHTLLELGWKAPEPRDLVYARRICAQWERVRGYPGIAAGIEGGDYDGKPAFQAVHTLLREYARDVAAKRLGYRAGWGFVRNFNRAHIGYIATVELAKSIAQYEQPPVDPDEEALLRILKAYGAVCADDGISEARDADWPAALAQFKRELEARK